MKFQNFLNEKISKIEYEAAIKNPNVLCGGEFEFYADDQDFTSNDDYSADDADDADDDTPSYDDAYRQWDQYTDELTTARKKYEDTQEEINDKREEAVNIREEADDKYDERLDKDETILLEYDISDLKDAIYLEKEKLNDLEDKDEIIEKKEDISELEKELNDLEDKVDTGNEQREDYIYDLDSATDLENDANDMEENILDYVHIPSYKYYQAYVEYMKYYHGVDPSEEYYEMGDDNIPPEPEEPDEDEDEDEDEESSFEEQVTNWLDNTKPPFGNNYRVEETPTKHSNWWGVVEDGSLSLDEGGIEIVSPPLEIEEFVDITEDMFDWINDIGETNSSTGFHVHMSVIKGAENFDPLKLLLFMEEGYIWKYWSDRKCNQYCKSIFNKTPRSYDEKDLKSLVDFKKIDKDIPNSKYDGVNFINLKDGHVEFRYMGSDYSNKFKDVKNTLARYSYWLSIACDPDFKRKEYLLKINKMFIKKEYSIFYNRIKMLEYYYKAYKKRNIPNLEIDKWFTYEIKKAGKDFATVGKSMSSNAKMDALKNISIGDKEVDAIDEYINTNAKKYLGGELYKYLKSYRVL